MASKALDQVEGPVQECVSQTYTLLIAAARDAATVAGEHTEAAMNGKVPLNVPEFKTFIMPAVVRAMDEWRTEAEKSELLQGRQVRSQHAAGPMWNLSEPHNVCMDICGHTFVLSTLATHLGLGVCCD